MTVSELLERIMAAYPGATPEALKAFKPVFYARFRHREGPALEAAALEVLAAFRPKFDQKFPIPADFEPHMPVTHPEVPGDLAIRAELDERANRRHVNIQRWMEGQGAKIRAARAQPVYAACLMMAMEHCARASWRYLSPEQIEECEMRALSTARVKMFGPLPKTNEAWDSQLSQVRAAWAQPEEVAA